MSGTGSGKDQPSFQAPPVWEGSAGRVPGALLTPLLQAVAVPFLSLGNPGPGAKLNLESEVSRVPELELSPYANQPGSQVLQFEELHHLLLATPEILPQGCDVSEM